MPRSFEIPQHQVPHPTPEDYVFPFLERKIGLAPQKAAILQRKDCPQSFQRERFFGFMDGQACWVQEWFIENPQLQWVDLRKAFFLLSEEEVIWAGRGAQILRWLDHHRYCGQCAHPTEELPGEWGILCPSCGLIRYPRINPAIIVAITRGQEILLVHKKISPPGHFSLVAGYLEAGESAEEGVIREALEEAGVHVGAVEYLGSQSWPFPDALMLGYRAQYLGGTPKPDMDEITELGWYSKETLPSIPFRGSIARKIMSLVWNTPEESLDRKESSIEPG